MPVSGNTVQGGNTHMYSFSFHNSPETFTHTVLFLTYIHAFINEREIKTD